MSEHILIIDDDPDIVQFVRLNLELEGYGVESASGGVEGIERAIADPFRFRQIIRNLLDNSHRYGGGRAQIRLESGVGDVRIQVADNGSGVLPVDVDRIFDPYQRTHRTDGQPESLGIGLSISRELATLMHGDLTYRRKDQWTIFELTLPVGPRVQDGQAARQDPTGTGGLHSIEQPRLQGPRSGSDDGVVATV